MWVSHTPYFETSTASSSNYNNLIFQARRIPRVSFGPATIERHYPISRGPWSQESALDSGLNYTAVKYTPGDSLSPAFYERWSLYHYIMFGSSDDYVSGLTAYLRPECRLVGYAHGHRYQLAGSNDSIALHPTLRRNERIVAT